MSYLLAPPLLARRSSDEYKPLTHRRCDLAAIYRVTAVLKDGSHTSLGSAQSYLESRLGTVATLRAIDAEAGGGFYDLPADAAHDRALADELLAPRGPVIDVQTHLVDPRRWPVGGQALEGFLRMVEPQRWSGSIDPEMLDGRHWAAQVFGGSETAVALITALPGTPDSMVLPNSEIAAVRDVVDRYAGTGRVLTHTIVHPNAGDADREKLVWWRDTLSPSAWKVYTLWGPPSQGGIGFELDDERTGIPFLEAVRNVGPRIVCAHKGIAGPVPGSGPVGESPRDIGPAAALFPDIDFVVYHSGYEIDEDRQEAAYDSDGSGVNRLVASLENAQIPPHRNVWAELGSTWFLMLRRPAEAAHVLGKLLLAVGPERIVWGTDSIWYGPPQPLIDAFRAFSIPDAFCEQHGYPRLTPEIKQRILATNATTLYGLDADALPKGRTVEELSWLDEVRAGLSRRNV